MLVDGWGVVKGSAYLWVSVGNLCNPQPFHGLGGGGCTREGEYSPGLCRGTQQTQYGNLRCYYSKFASL